MSLETLTCYQPKCDHEGCKFILEGDVEYHYKSPEEAAATWRDYDGWTDLKTWLCEDHVNDEHDYIGEPNSACDRCHVWVDVHETPAGES